MTLFPEASSSDGFARLNTRDTLQDTARLQVENNKKSKRLIYQQSAARGSDYVPIPPTLSPTPSKARDLYTLNGSSRMRSGSGTSRTTNTSDSGELEVNGLGRQGNSVSSSPSQPSGGGMSYHSQSPSVSSSMAQSNPASVLSSFATRVLERDADAMEKYMRRNRSESQGTASTDSRSANGSLATGPPTNGLSKRDLMSSGTTTPKRLRPSISAQQLRSGGEPLLPSNSRTQHELRNRSGTSPASVRPPPSRLTRSSSITHQTSKLDISGENIVEEPENFTGPPSQYAQFPEPPLNTQEPPTPIATRRMAFYSAKPKEVFDNSANHRRVTSSTSLRSPNPI